MWSHELVQEAYKNDLGLDLIVKQTADNHVTNAGAYWGSWRKNLSADVLQIRYLYSYKLT